MGTTTDPTQDALATVRALCHGFEGTEEKPSHGAPFFHVRGRGYLIVAMNHHGDGRTAVWCKAGAEDQRRLVREDPSVYFIPPYVGVKGWVGVRLDVPGTDLTALAMLVEAAWLSVVPQRRVSRRKP